MVPKVFEPLKFYCSYNCKVNTAPNATTLASCCIWCSVVFDGAIWEVMVITLWLVVLGLTTSSDSIAVYIGPSRNEKKKEINDR